LNKGNLGEDRNTNAQSKEALGRENLADHKQNDGRCGASVSIHISAKKKAIKYEGGKFRIKWARLKKKKLQVGWQSELADPRSWAVGAWMSRPLGQLTGGGKVLAKRAEPRSRAAKKVKPIATQGETGESL